MGRPVTVSHAAISAMADSSLGWCRFRTCCHLVSRSRQWARRRRRGGTRMADAITAGSCCTATNMGADRGDPGKSSCSVRDAVDEEVPLQCRWHAAIAYCPRLGFAVVSGDPIGVRTLFEAGVSTSLRRGTVVDGVSSCWAAVSSGLVVVQCRGYRPVATTGAHWTRCRGRCVPLQHGRAEVPMLRQAVQRTHNAGITTEVVAEQELDNALAHELAEVLNASHRGAYVERVF